MSLIQGFAYARAAAGILQGSRSFGGPIEAILNVTNRCNIRCIHCYFYSPLVDRPNLVPTRRARQMSLELPGNDDLKRSQKLEADTERTQTLIDELMKMGTARFEFTGKGELFLHKDILEFMRRVKYAGRTCIAVTNGTLLDRETIDEMIKMKFDELRVTTMAGSREMYMRTHGGTAQSTFDGLKDNLSYLAAEKAARGIRHPKVTLAYVVISENYDGIDEFVEFARLVRADRVLFLPLDDIEDRGLSQLVLTEEQSAYVRERLVAVKPLLETWKIGHNIGQFLKVFREQLDTTELYRVIPCYYGWLSVVIETDGSVYPCCRCYEPMGNIQEKEFREIWNGEAYRRFRREAIRINGRKTPVSACDCNSCVHHTANLRAYRLLHLFKGRCLRTLR